MCVAGSDSVDDHQTTMEPEQKEMNQEPIFASQLLVRLQMS